MIREGISLDDFRELLVKPRLATRLLGWLTATGILRMAMRSRAGSLMDREGGASIEQVFAIIDSMTAEERTKPWRIDAHRLDQLASDAGALSEQVLELILHFESMAPHIQASRVNGLRIHLKSFQHLRDYPYAEANFSERPCHICGGWIRLGSLLVSHELTRLDGEDSLRQAIRSSHPGCLSTWIDCPENLVERLRAHSYLSPEQMDELEREIGS